MEPTSNPTESGGAPAVVAIAAAVGGVASLVVAAVLLSGAPEAPPVAAGASTTSPAVATSAASSTTTTFTFDPGALVVIGDDSEVITAEVPREWADVSGTGWTVDGDSVGAAVTAAPDIDAWYSTWGTPGVFIGVATSGFQPDPGDFFAVCTEGERVDRSTDVVRGQVQVWSGCGDEGSDFYVFSGSTVDGGLPVLVEVVIVDRADRAIFDHIMTTLRVAR